MLTHTMTCFQQLSIYSYTYTQRTNLQKEEALIQYTGKIIIVEICEHSDIDKKKVVQLITA